MAAYSLATRMRPRRSDNRIVDRQVQRLLGSGPSRRAYIPRPRCPGRHMYDIVIRNGTVIDGSGVPGFSADVGIRGGRIVAVGAVEGSAIKEIEATGLLITPGF